MSFLGKSPKMPKDDERLAEARRRAAQAEQLRRGRGATLLTGAGLGDVAAPVARPVVQGG
jgi:hypothetical protein